MVRSAKRLESRAIKRQAALENPSEEWVTPAQFRGKANYRLFEFSGDANSQPAGRIHHRGPRERGESCRRAQLRAPGADLTVSATFLRLRRRLSERHSLSVHACAATCALIADGRLSGLWLRPCETARIATVPGSSRRKAGSKSVSAPERVSVKGECHAAARAPTAGGSVESGPGHVGSSSRRARGGAHRRRPRKTRAGGISSRGKTSGW